MNESQYNIIIRYDVCELRAIKKKNRYIIFLALT